MRRELLSLRRRVDLADVAELAWKAPFVLAATLMVGAGAAQSMGRTGVPPLAALAALGLAAAGTVLATLALWRPRRPHPVLAVRAIASSIANAIARTITHVSTRARKGRS